jgi:hypothetical protein
MRETDAVAAARAPSRADAVANLRAFAKLYGYVHFFHPSDEASSIEWERFAVLGAGRVLDCSDAESLRSTLVGLFGPFAPTVQVYGAGVHPKPVKLVGDSATCLPVCWQHRGPGLQNARPYSSQRTNRPKPAHYAERTVVQSIDLPSADANVERSLRVRVRARSEEVESGDEPIVFGVGINLGEDRFVAVARASGIPVSGAAWRVLQVEVPIEPGQAQAAVGVAAGSSGTLWADDFEAWVSSGDSWLKLDLKDPGFEDSLSLEESPAWVYSSPAEKTEDRPFAGAKCLHMIADTSRATFAGSPAPGEFVDKLLDRGLMCRVPLCLWSEQGKTLPHVDSAALECLRTEIDAIELDTPDLPPPAARLGAVVIAWTAAQHFYPYFDVVPTDWDVVLTETLAQALADAGRLDFHRTLRRMAVALYDSHANGSDLRSDKGMVKARLDIVEGRIVVIAARQETGLHRGDVLLEINGRSASEVLGDEESCVSGSPHWRHVLGLFRLLFGPKNEPLRFLVERGTGTALVSAMPCEPPGLPLSCDTGDCIRELEPGIWYVDLTRAPMPAIDSVMDKLAKAEGAVFDLRGYPCHNHDVISHLLTGKEKRGERWMWIPRIVYPDHERIDGWDGLGFAALLPREPHIAGKVVFLTDGSAVSYAESFMGHIEGLKLADIVGRPTAGTNGNIVLLPLPGGFQFSWTGMKVTKFDGSQHHLIGIQPTVPLERTLKAVREGRDEYIEKALQLIRGS